MGIMQKLQITEMKWNNNYIISKRATAAEKKNSVLLNLFVQVLNEQAGYRASERADAYNR